MRRCKTGVPPTVAWDRGAVVLIDQKALPGEERLVACRRPEEVAAAIRDLTVRGAPAIGVAAAMGIALGVSRLRPGSDVARELASLCDLFAQTRPTARNLFWAIERMQDAFAKAAADAKDPAGGESASGPAGIRRRGGKGGGRPLPPDLLETVRRALVAEAIRMAEEDVAANRRLGAWGQTLIADGDRILTHCNAGALATAGYGTALGVIRAAWAAGKRIHVYVDETRPVLQGARLTAWELLREGIPATLITDSMAGWMMRQGRIHKVVVGADRIAANGDTANKIGTYALAVLARAHRIPLYVAAPFSTVDPSLRTGRGIPIEERTPDEVTRCGDRTVAPRGISVCNPAFDVTPHRYIAAIITEKGVFRPPFRAALRQRGGDRA